MDKSYKENLIKEDIQNANRHKEMFSIINH